MCDRVEDGAIGLLSSSEIKTGFVRALEGEAYRPIVYSVVDGMAIFEGCIVLGTAEHMEQLTRRLQRPRNVVGAEPEAIAITGERFRWTHSTVPWRIDPGLPDRARVTDAIAHWQEKTKMTFVERADESDFITFRPGNGCSSPVGRCGGEQFITMSSSCTVGNIIHEIGHAVGLWHEQSREDRDRFIRIVFENIDQSALHNFNQHITDGDDIGEYDYDSIMHYPKTAFSRNGLPTIEPVGREAIGQRVSLSAGDIAAVHKIYGL